MPTSRYSREAHALGVTPADRRFTAWLLLGFGPLFVLGGFAAAFTDVGALLVFVGLAMVVTGGLLFTPLRLAIAVLAGVLVFSAFTAQMVLELNSR